MLLKSYVIVIFSFIIKIGHMQVVIYFNYYYIVSLH